MKVKYATQAFSHTVSCALSTHALAPDSPVPTSATKTANFFKFMDTLFDCFNSSNRYESKPFKCALQDGSVHFDFLTDARDYINRLVKLNPNGKFTRPPSFTGWAQNITALLQFWEDAKADGVDFLRTRLLSQDFLENLFGVIRGMGGSRDNPTADQFRDALRQAMVSDVLNLRHPEGNCESDTAKFLFDFNDSKKPLDSSSVNASVGLHGVGSAANMDVPAGLSSVPVTSVTDENICFYVAGVCVREFVQCLKDHDQCTCALYVRRTDAKFSEPQQIFTHLKAYADFGDDFGALSVPTDNFIKCITGWNDIFHKNIDHSINDKNVIWKLKNLCLETVDLSWFPENPICREKLITVLIYFLRIRIFYMLKTINQSIVDGPKTKENRKYRNLSNL